jgi:hypothetical protein
VHSYVTTCLPFFYYATQIEARMVLSRFSKEAAHNASMFHKFQELNENLSQAMMPNEDQH